MVIQESNWWNRLTAQLCCTRFVEMKTTNSCAKNVPKIVPKRYVKRNTKILNT